MKLKSNLSSSMNILITGGNGMLGKNLLEHVTSQMFSIFTPTSEELNLLDSEQIKSYLKIYQINFIIHCAGVVGGIQANIANPVKFLNENLSIGMNLVNSAFKVGICQFLNVGSSCMYPKDYVNPLKESYLLQGLLEPTNEAYALAKITVAKLCEYYAQQYSLSYKTVIPCNLYGRWDKFSDQYSHMLPAVIKKMYFAKENNLSVVDVWGGGQARREFMYAGDCADAIWFCVDQFETMPQYVNIGLGVDYSIIQYYQAVAKVLNYHAAFKHDLSKPEGMKQKLVDNSMLRNLGWQANHSLAEGVSKTIDFYKKEVLCTTQK